MKGEYSKYTISIAEAESTMEVHLQKLRNLMRSSLSMHEGTIRGLITFCHDEKVRSIILHQSKVIQWMINEVRGRTTKYAAKRFQAASRYLSELYRAGLIPDNPMNTLKVRCGNRSWDCITIALRGQHPKRAINKLHVVPSPQGPLHGHIRPYIELQQSLGKKYREYERTLIYFDQFIASKTADSVDTIDPEHVRSWLDTMQCGIRTRRSKAYILKKFIDQLVTVGVVKTNPLDIVLEEIGPRSKTTFQPFIFSKDQIVTILQEAKRLPKTHKFPLRSETMYTVIALLYALGLRGSEARNLRVCHVNLDQCTLFIEQTKFNKSRLIPFGPNVAQHLEAYMKIRRKLFVPMKNDDPLFIAYRRVPIGHSILDQTFRDIITAVRIQGRPKQRGPRLHDLRHSFAVHRLLRWYREGIDVQSKLMYLSTFMGHVEICSTEIYLSITAELLKEANNRFYQKFGTLFEEI